MANNNKVTMTGLGENKDADADLDKDLDDLFDDDESILSGLEDTPKQTITNEINAFRQTDDQRSKNVYTRRLARTAKDRDGVKNANAAIVMTRARLKQVMMDLIESLMRHPEFYREVANWLDWPRNLRPMLRKQLKARGHDVGSYIDAAEEIEAERTKLLEASTVADSDERAQPAVATAQESG